MTDKIERKRSLTLNLSDEEMAMLKAISDREGMSMNAVLRQAIKQWHARLANNDGRES